jgi:hypothetical protein
VMGLGVRPRPRPRAPARPPPPPPRAAANVVTIAAGPLVFDEPLPDGTVALTARLVGFTAVIAGAILTPGPEVEDALNAEAPEPATA